MEWIDTLLVEHTALQAVVVIALICAVGMALGKVRLGGVSLGVTFVFFVGILAGHIGLSVDGAMLEYAESFGLVLFVYSLGLQVGPGFFSSFHRGGVRLNLLGLGVIAIGTCMAVLLSRITPVALPEMMGVLCGATTNTPALGAAQQTLNQLGIPSNGAALSCAVTYPLGVVGIIFSMIFIRYALRIRFEKEDEALAALNNDHKKYADKISIQFTNAVLDGRTVGEIKELINREFVISRVADAENRITVANQECRLHVGDKLLVVCSSEDTDAITAFLGHIIDMPFEEWGSLDSQLVSRRILITKPSINGKKFADLHLRTKYGINITRVNRSGVVLFPLSLIHI